MGLFSNNELLGLAIDIRQRFRTNIRYEHDSESDIDFLFYSKWSLANDDDFSEYVGEKIYRNFILKGVKNVVVAVDYEYSANYESASQKNIQAEVSQSHFLTKSKLNISTQNVVKRIDTNRYLANGEQAC